MRRRGKYTVSLNYNVTPEQRDDLLKFAQAHNTMGVTLVRKFCEQVGSLVEKHGDVRVVVVEHLDALCEGEEPSLVIERALRAYKNEPAPPPKEPEPVDMPFTQDDVDDFVNTCTFSHLDPRFALRKCITAMQMRQIR